MRGKPAPKRKIPADEVYGSQLVSKLINYVMQHGKKDASRKIVYGAIEELQTKTKTKGIEALEKAIENVKPQVEVRSKRVGGSNYQVPMPVRPERQQALALRWIIESMRSSRGGQPSSKVLARELLEAFNGEGAAIRRKEEVKRMADANRAFAQFA